jgi:hypothetical protein
VFSIFTRSLQLIYKSNKFWLIISAIIVTLAAFVGNITAQADKSDRSTLPQIPNGVYLFGEADRSNVVGKEYIIIEIIGNKAIGAFYMPRSEFNCFYGQLKGSRLNLTLIDTFEHQKYNYTLTLNSHGLTAGQQPTIEQPTYRPLSKIGAIDRQILTACKVQLKNKQ